MAEIEAALWSFYAHIAGWRNANLHIVLSFWNVYIRTHASSRLTIELYPGPTSLCKPKGSEQAGQVVPVAIGRSLVNPNETLEVPPYSLSMSQPRRIGTCFVRRGNGSRT